MWEQWKKGFDVWEQKTADLLEGVLKRPAVLQPVGTLLSASLRVKAKLENATTTVWGSFGLPTKREQERTLHALNQLNSKLIDLEEKLAELKKS